MPGGREETGDFFVPNEPTLQAASLPCSGCIALQSLNLDQILLDVTDKRTANTA